MNDIVDCHLMANDDRQTRKAQTTTELVCVNKIQKKKKTVYFSRKKKYIKIEIVHFLYFIRILSLRG